VLLIRVREHGQIYNRGRRREKYLKSSVIFFCEIVRCKTREMAYLRRMTG
jgi:hypothetical protein